MGTITHLKGIGITIGPNKIQFLDLEIAARTLAAAVFALAARLIFHAQFDVLNTHYLGITTSHFTLRIEAAGVAPIPAPTRTTYS